MPKGWDRMRSRVLRRDPICRLNYPGICSVISTEVDHILRDAGDIDSNLEGVCGPCHRYKTQQEARQARQRQRG
jgi:5-methylcytosine-specific restriction enzyme A